MTVSVIVGTQWGDEGKGKITDILAADVDLVVRYQGGNNAGHTIIIDKDVQDIQMIITQSKQTLWFVFMGSKFCTT